uniref:Pentraxin 4, long n=1 Tax=Denticeps clupeoides TaxID=299321 RepID=A0AAY4D195_9TELE
MSICTTLGHLQSTVDKISYSIDTHFRLLTQQYDSLSRDLSDFKASTDAVLSSVESWNLKLQKKIKKLDMRATSLERALRATRVSHRLVHEQKVALSNLTHDLHEHRNHAASVKAHQAEVRDGMRSLQSALVKQQIQLNQLEDRMKSLVQPSGLHSRSFSQNPLQGMQHVTKPQPKPSKKGRMQKRLPSPRLSAQTRNHRTEKGLRTRMHGSRQTVFQTESHSQSKEVATEDTELPVRHKIPQLPLPQRAATICNVNSMLLFPSTSTENYATFRKGFTTSLHEISICTWLRVDVGYMGTLLSYATADSDNKLVLYGRNISSAGSVDFVIGDPVYRELPIDNILDNRWHHMCIIWSSIEGQYWQYTDRRITSTGSRFQKGYEIPPGGTLILGQEQDSVGGDFDEAEAFVGRVAGFAIWTRVLSPGEVSWIATGKGLPRGTVITLDDVDQVKGSVKRISCGCLEHCT